MCAAYDELPFESQATPDRSIDRFAVTAALFGFTPADPASARVLEIGCSTGANLIPQALRFPAARFTGLDLSAAQIEIARASAAAVKTASVTFERCDFAAASFEPESFDYIICHGVYSWIPETAQQELLTRIARWLRPAGVCLVSHNSLPGWRHRAVLRERLVPAAEGASDALERIGEARRVLDRIANSPLNASDPEYALLRREAQVCAAHSDGYILHELLAPDCSALTLTDLDRRAGEAGLRFIGDANPRRNRRVQERFRSPGPGGAAAREQDIDIRFPIPFRSSLLSRAVPEAEPRIRGDLYLSSPLVPVTETRWEQGPQQRTFVAPDETLIESENPRLIALLLDCAAAWPGAVAVSFDGAELEPAVRKLYFEGRVELHYRPLRCRPDIPELPCAFVFARQQSRAGHAVTTLRHEVLNLNPFERVLIGALDGTRDRAGLETVIRRALHDGELILESRMREEITAPGSPFLSDAIGQTLEHFREQALLEGQ